MQQPSSSPVEHASPSDARQPPVGEPTARRAQAWREEQVSAVGRAFLRWRPLIVAPVAIANAALGVASGAPGAQRAVVGAGVGLALAFFAGEALVVRKRAVGTRWLSFSLALTLVALASGAAFSGGVASPLLPLVPTPVVVAFAAFGRRPFTAVLLAAALGVCALCALLPLAAPFEPLTGPAARAMVVVSFGGALGLCYAGVAGLVTAHARTAELCDRMRLESLGEAASRMRAVEQVGATVAHELKNPLAAVRALLQLMAESDARERSAERSAVALAELDRMAQTLADYLSFARPLAPLEVDALDLERLAADVVALYEARAQALGVRLVLDGVPMTIRADARRVREAVANLVGNALAATPAGGEVVLAVAPEPAPRAGAAPGALVTVTDSGSGLADVVRRAPGTPFVTTKRDGTGLGLAIAQGAARQHGGSLELAPRPGGGTIASMRLPCAPGAAEANVEAGART